MSDLTPSEHFHFTSKARWGQERLRVPGLLLLLTLIYFWPQLVQGRVLYWGDIGLYFTPMSAFLRENLRAGRVPLWNPLIFCGTPYAGNPQTWPLYPVTALLPFVSASYFLSLTIALHVWLAGVGTYVFARRALGVGRGAAGLAAVTFMFGGQLISKGQFPNMVQASAWLPWVLWTLDRTLRERRVRDALGLGLVVGMQLLAAHAQMTLLTLYLALAWGVFVLQRRETGAEKGASRREAMRRLAALLAWASITAAGLAAGQILPTVALFRDAARQKLSFHLVNRFFLPGHQLGNFVLPRLHGHPFQGNWTAPGNFWETCCYVGWVSFGLAVWAAIFVWRKGGRSLQSSHSSNNAAARFWTGVFVLGLWMALGGRGGLYHLVYFVLPGFRAFHDPARCLLWACFALSLLAGYGLERVRLRSPVLVLGVLLLAFADLAHFGRTVYPLADARALFPIAPNVATALADPDIRAHQARVLAPSAGVWLRFTSYKDFRQDAPDYQTLWADTLTPNQTMPYGLLNAYGYEPVALKNAQTITGEASASFDLKTAARDQAAAAGLAGVLGVKYVALCRVIPPEKTISGLVPVRAAFTLTPPGKPEGAPAKVYLSRNAQWQPRARLEGSPVPVTLREDGPDQVTLSCVTTGPARLVLADTQAAGWRAEADGRPALIETYGGSLRAVRLAGAGEHRVVFSYVPTSYRLGLYFSLLTLAALAAAAAFAGARNIARREGIGGTKNE